MNTVAKIILLTAASCLSFSSFGNTVNPYAVSNIPKELLLDANAVVRNDQMIQTIEDIDHSRVKVKHTTTLLNEKASGYRFYRIPYNKFIKISGIKANVYDSNGELIPSVRPDIRDMSGNFGELATDTRYWVISCPVRKYPFTIEIEYDKVNTGSFVYENWSFQSRPDVSVEQSGMQLLIKKGIGFRVSGQNLKHPCDTFSLDDKVVYTWQEENIPAFRKEELFMISFDQKFPYILVAPNEFSMGAMSGNMESWESLGKFHYDLNKDRDRISAELQSRLRQLISGSTDRREMVRKIFAYMQKNTRYESIQLGIGGYQTLEASFVEKKGYGDCKALTNFMKAMLQSVGIKSYQALISSEGDQDINTRFPSHQFDHVILCVPMEKDTVWLECTDQSIPFDYLGGSDGNKHVLLLTENGGKIVKTPDYRSKENNSSSTFTVSIDLVGGAVVKGKMRYRGVAYERPDYILNSTKEKREEYINDLFSSPNITINNLTYSKDVSNYPVLTLECNISVRDFVSRTKKRMVFNPYLFAPHPYMPKTLKEDFIVNSTKVITDTVEYSYPFGYSPEYIPEAIQVETRFGKYQCQVQVNGDKLFFTRKFEYYQGDYAREEVAAFAEFVNKIADSGRQRIILKKN